VTLVVVFALAAAFSNAVNLISQHKASISAPRREKGWRLVLYLPRQLTDWPIYAFIAATVTGTLLQQAALHVGPLSVSQPFLVITDPFASIILSVWLFDERFTDSPAKITVAVLAFAVMAVGVTVLTRTAPEDLTPS
jgi:drug/metabolite transporter (DMT)-like permease